MGWRRDRREGREPTCSEAYSSGTGARTHTYIHNVMAALKLSKLSGKISLLCILSGSSFPQAIKSNTAAVIVCKSFTMVCLKDAGEYF